MNINSEIIILKVSYAQEHDEITLLSILYHSYLNVNKVGFTGLILYLFLQPVLWTGSTTDYLPIQGERIFWMEGWLSMIHIKPKMVNTWLLAPLSLSFTVT